MMAQSRDNEVWIDATETYVRRRMIANACGHDWDHTDRVRKVALRLAEAERCDRQVVELAALLHDVGDPKLHGGDESVGPMLASQWLLGLGCPAELARQVSAVVASVSFKGAGVADQVGTPEAAVVQDADRLDAIGAIGIARAFAFGASRARPMHTPDRPPTPHASVEAYRASTGSTINHFYEKLLLLKDRLRTPSARAMADGRHQLMVAFVEQFEREWQGK